MQINIQGRHLAVTPSLYDYVKGKAKKIKVHFDHIIYIHVTLEVIRQEQIAEATITAKHHYFHNRMSSKDLYKSIDLLFDKLDTQVKRYKESHFYAPRGKHIKLSHDLDETNPLPSVTVDDVPLLSTKPMSDVEAILQLDVRKGHRYAGYINSQALDSTSFLIRKSPESIDLVVKDGDVWQRREGEWKGEAELEIKHIENELFITEAVEDAIDYLLHNKADYRLFRSVRTQACMLLFELSKDLYGVIREQTRR